MRDVDSLRPKDLTIQQITRFYDKANDYKVRCKCSHTQFLHPTRDKGVCSYCGRTIYKDKKTEMKYKLKELMK